MVLVPIAPNRAWIMAQRPPRPATPDPFRPQAFFLESERAASGQILSCGTILLTNKECPWRCLMCDLWQHTLTESVPSGAIPQQIDFALARLDPRPEQIKLYNSGSFFDPAAIPPVDYPEIARLISFARQVIVESHPRLLGDKVLRWRDLLPGALEVAMGLETIHPEILPRLQKNFELAHFTRAAAFLRKENISVRAFVLVKPPFMTETEGLEWAVKSAEFAFSRGASVVSLIPTRGGNGALEQLQALEEFAPPTLTTLERAQEQALNLRGGRVFADTWNLQQFSRCPICFEQRRQRLSAINLSQALVPAIDCAACEGI